jgi:hypothetical protein
VPLTLPNSATITRRDRVGGVLAGGAHKTALAVHKPST